MKCSVRIVKHNQAVSNPLAKQKPPIRGAQIIADLALKIGGGGRIQTNDLWAAGLKSRSAAMSWTAHKIMTISLTKI